MNNADWIPESIPAAQRQRAQFPLRYEDVTQDGRLVLTAVAQMFGPVWQKVPTTFPAAAAMARSGTIAILSRLVVEAGGGPIGVGKPVNLDGGFQLAHGVDGAGAVNRLYFNAWIAAEGVVGRTYGPPPPGAGSPIAVGRSFGESVFTRPFGPPESRRVLRFEGDHLEGLPPVPPIRHEAPTPASLLVLPDTAVPLDPALVPDDAPLAFGMVHTDSNQHVNSLVYLRLFEEAALRRLAAHGRAGKLYGRRIELSYRKPSFAGERLRIHLQAFKNGPSTFDCGAVGTFVAEGDPDAKPRVTARIHFSE